MENEIDQTNISTQPSLPLPPPTSPTSSEPISSPLAQPPTTSNKSYFARYTLVSVLTLVIGVITLPVALLTAQGTFGFPIVIFSDTSPTFSIFGLLIFLISGFLFLFSHSILWKVFKLNSMPNSLSPRQKSISAKIFLLLPAIAIALVVAIVSTWMYFSDRNYQREVVSEYCINPNGPNSVEPYGQVKGITCKNGVYDGFMKEYSDDPTNLRMITEYISGKRSERSILFVDNLPYHYGISKTKSYNYVFPNHTSNYTVIINGDKTEILGLDGQALFSATTIDRKKEGPVEGYSFTAAHDRYLNYKGTYRNDLPDGTFTYYDESGQVLMIFELKNGIIVHEQIN